MGKARDLASAYWGKFKRNMKEEGGEYILSRLAEYGVRQLPDYVVVTIINNLSENFLNDADYQKTVAGWTSNLFGDLKEAVEPALIEIFEELGKIHRESKNDPDKFEASWAKLTSEDDDEDEEEDDDMARPRTTPAPAAPAAPAKPPEQTLLQVVGGLDAALQTKFWEAAQAVTQLMGTQDEKDAFLARVKRVTLSKEEVTAILNAPQDLRRDMLRQAVQRAFNAGGISGGFRSIMDSASDGLSHLLGGSHQPSNLAADLQAGNTAKRTERAKRNGIR